MTTRTPCAEIKQARVYFEYDQKIHAIPLYASRISAGHPSPADDYIEQYINLDKDFVKNPASTFLVIAHGDSMINAGIQSGDMLVIDQKMEPSHGTIVIAAIDGELTVKRLSIKHNVMQLLPENPRYQPIVITTEQHVVIWGVVTFVIKKNT
jgi:DNA polymerase V